MHASAFSDNSKLTHIRIHANDIETLPEDVFSGLAELKLLNLSHNRMEEIPDLFPELANLRVVSLSDNELAMIPATAFRNNPKLTHIYLAGNGFSRPCLRGCSPGLAV